MFVMRQSLLLYFLLSALFLLAGLSAAQFSRRLAFLLELGSQVSSTTDHY